ncbi:MAG: shikimate kinase [Gammaproteobacteria bacterium]|nr:shikimate kinase [Gammaproteobacteria bacterium]
MNIVLCGYQCCGKTTVGEAFSKAYDFTFIDTDNLISEEMASKQKIQYTVREIHRLLGEEKFRQLEKEVVRSIQCDDNTVIATGGGVFLNAENVSYLKTIAKIVYLKVDPSVLYERMMQQKTLPIFIGESSVQEDFDRYIQSRNQLYESCADKTLEMAGLSILECVQLLNRYRCENGQ